MGQVNTLSSGHERSEVPDTCVLGCAWLPAHACQV